MVGSKALTLLVVDCFLQLHRSTRFHDLQAPQGSHKCTDSKFYPQLQRCLWPWPWCQSLSRKLLLTSESNPSVLKATTTIHRTPAHPLAFTGQAISITVSFSAWAHGLVGAITTVGAAIASAAVEEEDITVEVVLRQIVDVKAAQR